MTVVNAQEPKKTNWLWIGLGGAALFCLCLFAGAHQSQQAAPQFESIQPDLFAVSGGQPNCWADFDNDGAPDAAFLNANGSLFIFANERSGLFRAREIPADFGAF